MGEIISQHVSDITTRKHFKTAWIDDMVYKIMRFYPDAKYEDALSYAESQYDLYFKDVKCTFFNNYEKEVETTSLKNLYDMIQDIHPLLSESGTLFKQHSQARNPDAEILKETLELRDVAKKKKFEWKENLKSIKANPNHTKREVREAENMMEFYDRDQKRDKIVVNSYYGASGLSSSRFYNFACASSTTARGQALISTARAAQEDFLADNVGFMSMDECIRFMILTCEEKSTRKELDSKWISDKTLEEVVQRLDHKFINSEDADNEIIKRFLANLDQEDLNRIYYKSNLEEFFLNSKKATKIIQDIASSPEEYTDYAKPPKGFADQLFELKNAILEYVQFCHPVIDRVTRLKFHKRKRVITIDTDSTFCNLGPWSDFVNEKIAPKEKEPIIGPDGYAHIQAFNYRSSTKYKNDQQRRFRIIYSMIYILTDMIARAMEDFMVHCNLEDMSYNTAKMKNEFLYDSILTTEAKKHYQGVIKVQEGHVNDMPELDVKGRQTMPHYEEIHNENLLNCWEDSNELISSQDCEVFKEIKSIKTSRSIYKFIYRVFISNYGRVKKLIGDTEYISKLTFDKTKGYYIVDLITDKGKHNFLIHRMVAMMFVDGYSDKMNVVNHLDGNKKNNFYRNLEWTNTQGNMIHASKNNLCHPKFGQDHYRSKLRDCDIIAIRKMINDGLSYKQMIDHFAHIGINISR